MVTCISKDRISKLWSLPKTKGKSGAEPCPGQVLEQIELFGLRRKVQNIGEGGSAVRRAIKHKHVGSQALFVHKTYSRKSNFTPSQADHQSCKW